MSRVVIIEDDPLMRSLLIEWLAAEGYQVECADRDNEKDASAADLVIVDLYMPRHLGVERLHSARRAYPQVPIIATSAQFRSGLDCGGSLAHAFGVAHVIAKPFDREALLRAVRCVIGHHPALDPG